MGQMAAGQGDQVGQMPAGWMLPGGHGCELCVHSSTQSGPPGGRFPLPFIQSSQISSQAPRQAAQTPSLGLGRCLPAQGVQACTHRFSSPVLHIPG